MTQKISREELDAVLKRTKSGTRPIVRSEPNLDDQVYAGPRDSCPQITIVSIDTIELEEPELPAPPADVPAPLVAPASTPSADEAPERASADPVAPRVGAVGRFQITPRMAFIGGIAVAVLIALAAFLGFFAGRVIPGVK